MGFIKVDRKLKDWQWFTKENMLLVWMYLLTSAFYEDGYFEGIEIKKGQVPIGRKSLSEKLNISEQQARTCIKRLKSTGEITTKSTNKFTVITVVKWADYQFKPVFINQQNNQEFNQQSTNNQPASNQQVTTYKEIKEQIEEKESFNNMNIYEGLLPEELLLLKENKWMDDIDFFTLLEEVFARPISQPEMQRLSDWQKEYSREYVYAAIREADLYKKHSFDYIDRILSTWKSEGKIFEEE